MRQPHRDFGGTQKRESGKGLGFAKREAKPLFASGCTAVCAWLQTVSESDDLANNNILPGEIYEFQNKAIVLTLSWSIHLCIKTKTATCENARSE
jgi:hypothetical protein